MKRVGTWLLPSSLVAAWASFQSPQWVEEGYAQSLYPLVARSFSIVNRAPFSIAELAVALAAVVAAGLAVAVARGRLRLWPTLARGMWVGAGLLSASFLLTWGCNYARPTLRVRMQLDSTEIDATAVLDAGRRTADEAARLYALMGPAESPTRLPVSFEELGEAVDRAFERIRLPGDEIRFPPAPTKRLASSTLFSYLGISGIYIPFTGEPHVNALQPDVAMPLVVAHEKAHQRGITDEGEANFAAFLACADAGSPDYLRYAAYLFAARYLLGEASRYVEPERLEAAWERLGEGPLADVRAVYEFWASYRGPATRVAAEVNDRYLRALRVEGGVQSYGTVVSLLVGLDRRGELLPEER